VDVQNLLNEIILKIFAPTDMEISAKISDFGKG